MISFIGKTAGKLYDKVVNRSKSSNQQQNNKNEKIQTDFYFKKRKLPPNFADDLLNLEIEIEQQHYTMKNIRRLLELYSIAIEYYESISSSKHFIFQNKLKTLMSNQNVIDSINDEHMKISPNKTPFNLSQKQKVENFHQEFLKNAANDLQMNRFLETYNDKLATMEGLIVGQLSNQQDIIMRRLEERKNKFNRPTSLPPPTKKNTEQDEKTPVFAKKNKEESPKFNKKQEKIQSKCINEEENNKSEEISNEKIKIIQKFKPPNNERITKFQEKTPSKNDRSSSPKPSKNERNSSPRPSKNERSMSPKPSFGDISVLPKFSKTEFNNSSQNITQKSQKNELLGKSQEKNLNISKNNGNSTLILQKNENLNKNQTTINAAFRLLTKKPQKTTKE